MAQRFLLLIIFFLTAVSVLTAATLLAADANNDGRVDALDFVAFFTNFSKYTSLGKTEGDFNNSGKVDALDFVVLFTSYGERIPITPEPSGASFSFGAAGDIGARTERAAPVLSTLPSSNIDFFVALGDLSYNHITPETAWCTFVKTRIGSVPFQLLAGNHESYGYNGLIDEFAKCLPNRLTITGDYAKEYYIDYPKEQPLARIILISPDLEFLRSGGGKFTYVYDKTTTNTHNGYRWLITAIDDARSRNITWIIVGMHKPCTVLGIGCESGIELQNLLFEKKVDLVLAGHKHTYQRSKQLTCATIDRYVPSCVVDDGTDNMYRKNQGTVLVVAGTGGASFTNGD